MNSIKTLLSCSLVVIALVTSPVMADAKSDATAACEAGDSAMAAAKKSGMLWTTTKKLMKKAKSALEKGDFDAAMKACKKAKFEGEASVKQAAIEADAWKTRVPR